MRLVEGLRPFLMLKSYTMGRDRRLLNGTLCFCGETIKRTSLLFANVPILCEWFGQQTSI